MSTYDAERPMRRIIVLGGFGFFGGVAVKRLRMAGLSPLIGSRRQNADVVVDVENQQSIRGALDAGDIVIDVVGPFQKRTTALVEAAIEIGFDVVDLADSLAYVESVYDLKDRIDAAGIKVFTACSSVSTVSVAMIAASEVKHPVRVTGILVPATRYTAVEATAASLFYSVGRSIRLFDDNALVSQPGWRLSRSFRFPQPLGTVTGHLFESADSITLPRIWPTLETANFFVDTNVTGLNLVFSVASRFPLLRWVIDKCQRWGLPLSRYLGHSAGGLGYEIEDERGDVTLVALTASDHGYLIPVIPAVLVAQRLAEGAVSDRGLLTPDRHIDPQALLVCLQDLGVMLSRERECEAREMS
jgi:hypothetical protein